MIGRSVLVLCALLAGAPVLAQTMYVTDMVLANVYEDPDQRQAIGRLPTGTPVEVIKVADGVAHVRLTPELEGWISTRWLSERAPAQSILLQLAEQHDRARLELATLRQQNRQDLRPELWLVAVIVGIALLAGFVFGAMWMDRRVRERHGGFRV